MTVDEILFDAEERMEKALAKLKQDLTGIRTGRASPGMVDSLRIEAYGSPCPIKQLASVSAPILLVPSVIVPEEDIALINPRHPQSALIAAVVRRKFQYNVLFRQKLL